MILRIQCVGQKEPSTFQLKGNTITFNVEGTKIEFSEGKFYPTFMDVKTTFYKNGLSRIMTRQFKKQE